MVYVVARATPEGSFEKIAECATTSFLDRSASAGPYRYRVLAVDFQENIGPWCDPVSVTATATVQPPEPSQEERDRPAYAAHVRAIHAAGRGSVRAGQATLFGDSLTGATFYAHLSGGALLTMRVDAFGHASKRTDFGRGNIARILQDQNPELVLILFGTNNRKNPASIPAAMADMEAIVQSCAAHGSIPIIGTIPPRGFKDPDSAPEAEFNRQLIEMAGRQKIPAAYIFESIQAAGPRQQFIARDGVHWNAAGMELAARAWARAVEQVRFTLRDMPDAQAASDKPE
jgi:lysophospholipase L1-like esterase